MLEFSTMLPLGRSKVCLFFYCFLLLNSTYLFSTLPLLQLIFKSLQQYFFFLVIWLIHYIREFFLVFLFILLNRADKSCRHACPYLTIRNILCYYRASSDDSIISNCYIWHDYASSPNENIVSNNNRTVNTYLRFFFS